MKCTFKVSIVGVGKVGATAAYALLLHGGITDLVLVARDVQKSIGEQLDLEHSLPFLQNAGITMTDDYSQIAGSEVTIVTAGIGQQPGEDRLSLLRKNLQLFSEIIPKIKQANPDGLVMIVTNPVDILTYHAYQVAAWQPGQVFGTGTLLDTARYRKELARLFHVNPRSIHAYILGEHGDSSFPFLSHANIGGELLSNFPEYNAEAVAQAYQNTKNAAYRIIESKGATYYAIGAVIMSVVRNIYADAKTVLPVSVPLTNYHGQSGVSISVPCIVGANGAERVVSTNFTAEEEAAFTASAEKLKAAYQEALQQG